jgi:hypothetical protein
MRGRREATVLLLRSIVQGRRERDLPLIAARAFEHESIQSVGAVG